MAKRSSMFFVVVLMSVAGALMSQSTVAQTTHTVGDSTGWRIPSGGAATYTTWASQQTFTVGDVLVFNFVAGSHDVTTVTKAAFDACTTSNPISSVTTTPANINLTSAGVHYFICSVSGHCDAGQKLSVTVSNPSTATPPTGTTSPPPPPSTTATSPPPPPSSAPSVSIIAIPVLLFCFVVGALFN